LVLGILLGLALRAQWHLRQSQLPGSRFSTLAPYYLGLREANDRLQKQVTDLRQEVGQFENKLATESQAAKLLGKQLQEVKLLAGLTPVKGPGLEITLRDSPLLSKLSADDPASDDVRIHDQDINAVVGELKAAGAEAIAIAGTDKSQLQRVTALTTARCAGPGVKVNDAVFGAPYTVYAIGNPKDLESQLRLPNGVLDNSGLELSRMIRIVHREEIEIPGFSGSIGFHYAHPTE
jgi:uncharacterized protein YlxW (UPF0749 family)